MTTVASGGTENQRETVLEITNLSKTYEADGNRIVRAIDSLSLSVAHGRFVCVVGPSGCGKTTFLRCVSGLLAPTGGTVRFRDRVVTKPIEELALVFQDYSRSLMPWMTVRNNVTLPLRHKVRDRAERSRLVSEAVAAVGLDAFLDHYPWQLSGGMQQRVAIARAIAYQPELLLMDEPFAAVDAQVRGDLEDLIMEVAARFDITVVLVTHDIDEAIYLADEVVVLSAAPTIIREVIDVRLPRPRDQIETKEIPDFAHLRGHVFRLIKGR